VFHRPRAKRAMKKRGRIDEKIEVLAWLGFCMTSDD